MLIISKNISKLLLLSSLWAVLAGCSAGVDKYALKSQIPADVNLVIGIDLQSLKNKSKAQLDGWRDNILKNIGQTKPDDVIESDETKEMFINMAKFYQVLDERYQAYLFFKFESKSKGYLGFIFKIKDEKAFEKLQLEGKKKLEITKIEGMSLIEEDRNITSWQKNTVVFWQLYKNPQSYDNYDEDELSAEDEDEENSVSLPKPAEVKPLDGFKKIFLSKNRKPFQNKTLTNSEKKAHDITLWFDFPSLLPILLKEPSFKNMKTENPMGWEGFEALKEMIGTLDFEKGKIVSDFTADFDKKWIAKYDKMWKNANKAISAKMLQAIPIEEPIAILGMHTYLGQMEESYAQAKDKETEQVKAFLKDLGITEREIAEALTGDIALVLGNLNVLSWAFAKPQVEVIGIAEIKDQTKIDRILQQLVKQDILTESEKGVFVPVNDKVKDKLYVLTKNNMLYLTVTEGLKDVIQKNKVKEWQLKPTHQAFMQANLVGFHINLDKLFKQIPSLLLASNQPFVDYVKPELKDYRLYAPPMKGNTMKMSAAFEFHSANRNSLEILIDMVLKIQKATQGRAIGMR